jgi:hypothetical protein
MNYKLIIINYGLTTINYILTKLAIVNYMFSKNYGWFQQLVIHLLTSFTFASK